MLLGAPGTPLAQGADSEQSLGGGSWPTYAFRLVSWGPVVFPARKGKEGRKRQAGSHSGVGCVTPLSGAPGPPAPHLRVRDFRGFLRQAAALGRDDVVVLGDVLVGVLEAARAGPGGRPREWGPGGQS